MLLALIWKFDFPPFMVLIIAILNDGIMMTISKDRVKPSPLQDSWKLAEIFTTGIVLGSYLAMMTIIFFWASYKTNFFLNECNVSWGYEPSVAGFKLEGLWLIDTFYACCLSPVDLEFVFLYGSSVWQIY